MRCDDVRESLSAHLDGEAMPLGEDLAQGHLAQCSDCQAWLDGAHRLTHSVRAQPAPAPDLTARILTAWHAHAAVTRRPRTGRRRRCRARSA